jgi:hypothetical protein
MKPTWGLRCESGSFRRWVATGSMLFVLLSTEVACNSSANVAVVNLSPQPGQASAVNSAFIEWEKLPSSCQSQIVGGSLRIATIKASGESWATADFKPVQNCTYSLAPARPGGPPRPVAVNQLLPWSEIPQPVVGVFEQPHGGNWTMNDEAGRTYLRIVFPCAVGPGGTPPGPGNGAIPLPVLRAWNLTPRSIDKCGNVNDPLEPQR